MSVNAKIAKIPFLLLYVILVLCTCFNWIRVILFQKDWEAFQTQQPWDYYLANFFSNTFGISNQQYFIFALPVVLLVLYAVPKLLGALLNLDKKTNIKGDNHVAIILILFIAPATLGLYKLFNAGWRSYLIPGAILILLFSLWSWIDEKNSK
jgi:hypothetical protein